MVLEHKTIEIKVNNETSENQCLTKRLKTGKWGMILSATEK